MIKYLRFLGFFRNLILGEHNELKNRYMLVGYDETLATPHKYPHKYPRK